jgi:hypothetical protein
MLPNEATGADPPVILRSEATKDLPPVNPEKDGSRSLAALGMTIRVRTRDDEEGEGLGMTGDQGSG